MDRDEHNEQGGRAEKGMGEKPSVHEEMLYDYEPHHDSLIINHCIHFMQLSINHTGKRH